MQRIKNLITTQQTKSTYNCDDDVVFSIFDRNGDGIISLQEMQMMCNLLSIFPTTEELQNIMNLIDEENHGLNISRKKFQHFLQQGKQERRKLCKAVKENEERLQLNWVFQKFDKDNDGFVSKQDLQSMFHSIGMVITEKEIDELFRLGDKDGDGILNFSEFETLYNICK